MRARSRYLANIFLSDTYCIHVCMIIYQGSIEIHSTFYGFCPPNGFMVEQETFCNRLHATAITISYDNFPCKQLDKKWRPRRSRTQSGTWPGPSRAS